MLSTLEALGRDPAPGLPAACAIELVHTFSLIHDDLPALDDDHLRRGLPTNHKVFGEATALLAGDALHALALRSSEGPPRRRTPASVCLAAVHCLRDAAVDGLACGQVADVQAGGRATTAEKMLFHPRAQDSWLFCCAVRLSTSVGHASARQKMRELDVFGSNLGLAFQESPTTLST